MRKIDKLLTVKQQEFIKAKDKRLNILSGSVRSGKTYVSLIKFAVVVVGGSEKGSQFLFVGRTLTTLKRNCLDLLTELVGESNFQYSISKKEGVLFGRKVMLEGATDVTSEQKIRGLTLDGAYCDEITLYPEEFVKMLLTRLSKPNAKLYATCNPDSPTHYIKKKYIDRKDELDCLVWMFELRDNTFLPIEYIENLENEFSGVFYDRFILGKWVKAEGLIWPNYDKALTKDEVKIPQAKNFCMAIDYGTQNAFAALLCAEFDGVWHVFDEYYYSGRDTGVSKADDDYADDMDEFTGKIKEYIAGKLEVIIDPSAASFIAMLKKRGRYKVHKGDNAVKDGLRETATAMNIGKIKIHENCKCLIEELGGYVWDENENPVKENDHACDALRYFVKTKHIVRKAMRKTI